MDDNTKTSPGSTSQTNSAEQPSLEKGVAHRYVLRPSTAVRSFTIPYEEELNPAQLKAVRLTRGPQLVIAGAGSGKTKTLVYRVAYLIESGVPADSILLLTFTKKAAFEMMRRASAILDGRCSSIHGGTFHSFANSTLRKYATKIGYQQNFTIADRSDSEDIISLIRTELDYGSKDKRFPKKNTIATILSKTCNTARSLEEILQEEYPQFLDEHDALVDIGVRYQSFKRDKSIMDYDDLLLNLRQLLQDHSDICETLSRENAYIMVDEFQDTNLLQADIAYRLASSHNNIVAVGDDAQSIYAFRGANFRNIMDFPKYFPECVVTTLEQNYRSTQPILDFCNHLMEPAREKYNKSLVSAKTQGHKPVYLQVSSVDEQAAFVAQRVLELREEGVELKDIAVLFRSGWHSNELEFELSSRNIPFSKFGGLQFVEASHIKDLISILRVVHNPRDAIAWHRLLLLFEGIGTKTAQQIIERLVSASDILLALKRESSSKAKFAPHLGLICAVMIKLDPKHASVAELVSRACEFYRPLLKSNYDDFRKRINDLDSIEHLAERYSSLEKYLDDLSLNPPESSQVGAEASSAEDEKLVLSTVHSAKGLEWHSVFVISLIDGYLPSSQGLNRPDEVEEERRLLYVACTRAQQNLYLICPQFAQSRGYSPVRDGFAFSEPSRFLTELDRLEQVTDKWVITGEAW